MSLARKIIGGRAGIFLGAAFIILALPVVAPQLLAFPYQQETAIGTIWSETELPAALIDRVEEQTAEKLARSPIADRVEKRPVFVTNGGWRWLWLASGSHDAFAITRPINTAVVVNEVDPATGTVSNGGKIGGQRALASVLAHEFTHGMIRRNFGIITSALFPAWKVEGYCDHVAKESSLNAKEVEHLRKNGISHPALPYYDGRIRVAEILTENGGSVEELFNQEH